MKTYTIEFTEKQLLLLINCVEDIHRFIGGEADLNHTLDSFDIPNKNEVKKLFKDIQRKMNPQLLPNERYSYNGIHAPTQEQKDLLANTYQLYREMRHFIAVANKFDNVYTAETLPGGTIGKPRLITTKDI